MRKLTPGLIALIILLTSCSTKKNTFTRRLYHNLTAHYNVYWNGRESLKEGVKSLDESIKDNYNEIIPVFNYGSLSDAQGVFANMDRAIEKASICIQKHSIYKNRKEHVRWIDDCYFLIGQAYFYKKEYISARRTFGYTQTEYKDNPIKYYATLWLGETYTQQEQYEKAITQFNNLLAAQSNSDFPKKIKAELPLHFANLFISQGKYQEAIPYLERSKRYNYSRDLTARVSFILGQIYQKDGDLIKATAAYNACVKKNPPYDMEFQARINMAQSYVAEGGNSKNLLKSLKRMLRESKNKNFRDQIYYALSKVSFEENQDSIGIDYLKKSVATSLENNFQKTTSALRLGEIYFDKAQYIPSQAYYDTAVQVIPEDYPDERAIKAKASVLSELVIDVETIQSQDSLQRIAKLPEADRNAFIDELITDYIEAEEQKKEDEWNNQFNLANGTNGPDFGNSGEVGAWYFYNTALISNGLGEFAKKWGKRSNSDLWRLSDKNIAVDLATTELAADSTGMPNDSIAQLASNPRNREYYLKTLPLEPKQLLLSDSLLIESFNHLAYLYYEGLSDLPNANKTYQEFLERFPENKYNLAAYYALYRINQKEGKEQEAETYKNVILNQFPDSDYAKVIQDPEYFAKLSSEKNAAGKLYDKAFQAWSREQFFRVIDYADQAVENYPTDTAYIPKFQYLRALSIGQVDVQDSMLVALKDLVKAYPKSQVSQLAENIISYTDPEIKAAKAKEEEAMSAADSLYSYDPKAEYFVTFALDNKSTKLNAFKVKVSDFNKKNYRTNEYKINSIVLNNEYVLVSIRLFADSKEAIKYRSNILNSEYVLSGLEKDSYYCFIISNTNYPTLYREKDVEGYNEYFESKFLQNK